MELRTFAVGNAAFCDHQLRLNTYKLGCWSVWLLESCQWILCDHVTFFVCVCRSPMNGARGLIPTSSVFFRPSGEIHGGTAVWALHTTRLLSMGLDRGGLALPADGIRFCFAWQGASTHDPQWVERGAKSHSQPVFRTLLPSPGSTVAVEIWASVLCWCCRTETIPLEGTTVCWDGRNLIFVAGFQGVLIKKTITHSCRHIITDSAFL